MVTEPEEIVADVVAAAGGRLTSRVRFQKIVYLLEKLGVESGFAFSYHHYGPYSRDLDSAILDAEAFDKITEAFENRKSDGARYSVFVIKAPHNFSWLSNEKDRARVKELASVNVTVLELAATAHWLAKEEKVADWNREIRARKGAKTAGNRLEEAVKLLKTIGLEPATV